MAKHGNRAASSAAGSADVLEELGIALEQPPERIARSIDELGFGFMFARAHHPAMRHVAPVRQELGTARSSTSSGRSQTRPGRATASSASTRPISRATYAEALAELGARHAFVVHGEGGLDELSPSGINLVVEVVDGDVREWELDPRDARHLPRRPDGAARRLGRPRTQPRSRAVLGGEAGGAAGRGAAERRGRARRCRARRRSRGGHRARRRRRSTRAPRASRLDELVRFSEEPV